MSRGLRNPNSIEALNELRAEIALELSSFEKDALDEDTRLKLDSEVNKRIVSDSRHHLIGFK